MQNVKNIFIFFFGILLSLFAGLTMSSAYSPKQVEVIAYENKHRPVITIMHGPIRTGKTIINNDLWFFNLAEAEKKNRDHILTAYTMGSLERNILKPLQDKYGIPIKPNQHGKFDYLGQAIHCFGADDSAAYKKMQGMTAYSWYANEITLQHENTVNEAIGRCSGEGARFFWDTNPDHPKHRIKTDFIDNSGELLSNGQVYIKAHAFQLEDNTFLTPQYIETLKRSIGEGVFYDRKIRGLWVAAEGVVYPGFSEAVHVVDNFKIPEEWPLYRAIDLGYNNPLVCLWGALSPDNILYVYDEHYESKQLIGYHSDRIKEREGRFVSTVRDHDAQDGAELENNGIYTRPARKDVKEGIQKVAARLKKRGNGKPGIFVFRKCINTIREYQSYQWEKGVDGKPVKETPKKIDDHAMDALRYLVQEVDGGGSQIWV